MAEGGPLVARLLPAVLVGGVAAQLAVLGSTLPDALAALTVALYVGGTLLAVRQGDAGARTLRLVATVALVVLALTCLPRLAGTADLDQLRTTLGLLLVGAQVAQGLATRTARDLRAGLLVTVGILVLGAATDPAAPASRGALVVGWLAVLVAVGLLTGECWARLLVPTALAVAVGLVAFLLVPTPRLHPRAPVGGRSSGTGSSATRATVGSGSFAVDLHVRGSLSNVPLLRVPADSPALWQVATYDTYEGGTWTRPYGGHPLPGPPWRVATSQRPLRTDVAERLLGNDGAVYSPGTLVVLDAPRGRVLAQGDGEVFLGGTQRDPSYTVTSEQPVAAPAQLTRTTGTDETEARWRQLPARLPARVVALAQQLTQGATSRWAMAQAMNAWLASNATYRLDSPVPRPGADAVDQFLFTDHTGFCEQFASAEAVMLRAVGVPARLVTGLAYGHPDGASRVYRGTDLHAWVQLWVPGTGWVTSDPTAGAQLATTPLARQARHPYGGQVLLVVALLVLAAVSAVVLRPRRRTAVPSAAGPATEAFRRLDARLGDHGLRPGESLRDLGRRLPPEVAQALRVVELEVYAPQQPDAHGAVAVLDAFMADRAVADGAGARSARRLLATTGRAGRH